MESPADPGKIFPARKSFRKRGRQPYQSFPRWHGGCFHPRNAEEGVLMITSVTNAGSYLRPTQAYTPRILTTADALPIAGAADTPAENAKQGIPVSDVKAIDMSQVKVISVRDLPELRDTMAKHWLNTQAANAAWATAVPDNAPQNTYATVKVNGKVVATLYNGGSVTMTNQAAAMVGDLQDPPGVHRDHAIRLDTARDGVDKLYPRATGCRFRGDDGRATEGRRAAGRGVCELGRHFARVCRRQCLKRTFAGLEKRGVPTISQRARS
jgi:hypothetical protein